MSHDAGYIDAGDRVICISEIAFKECGIVLSNNGWGRCDVKLDSGKIIDVMNGVDLVYEDEPHKVPTKPVKHLGIVP